MSTTTSPNIDMAKVAAAVANLTNPAVDRIRRPNPYHDLPPVDHARRRRLKTSHSDHCSGFDDPNFLH